MTVNNNEYRLYKIRSEKSLNKQTEPPTAETNPGEGGRAQPSPARGSCGTGEGRSVPGMWKCRRAHVSFSELVFLSWAKWYRLLVNFQSFQRVDCSTFCVFSHARKKIWRLSLHTFWWYNLRHFYAHSVGSTKHQKARPSGIRVPTSETDPALPSRSGCQMPRHPSPLPPKGGSCTCMPDTCNNGDSSVI